MSEKAFSPLLSAKTKRPPSQLKTAVHGSGLIASIRDDLTLSSWLLIGGLLQGIAVLALGYFSLIPPVLVLSYRIGDNLLMAAGLTKNRYLEGAVMTKFGAQIPREDGTFGSKPADQSVVVFLIGAKCSHPFGMLAPGWMKLNRYFVSMALQLEASPGSGLLGTSSWISNGEQSSSNTGLTLMYFRDYESLHKFAHGPKHMAGVRWWTQIVKTHPHLGIYHETYEVPKGSWENVYANIKPTGISATVYPIRSPEGSGEIEWMSPVVDARKGPLRTAAGRFQKDHLRQHDNKEIWDQTVVDYGKLVA
ncbi:hypothetical protein FQN50_005098 [Emmonsiellopsis sp. PD_5]|nr:hypothetical protein FQN50_005098 [Emmonsiellopsis sp. PD_5]